MPRLAVAAWPPISTYLDRSLSRPGEALGEVPKRMARNKWEELAGETGEAVPQGRWSRMLKLGGLGMKVSAATVASALARVVVPGSRERRDAAWSKAQEKNAQRVVKVLGQLKGASMKVGQILSADPDLIPPEYVDALTALQRNAPPMTWATVRDQIELAFDRPMELIFQSFQPEPIGSASIGQVHRARLASGEDVAVKVQYPGIVAGLQSDLKNLASVLMLGRAVVDKRRLEEWLEEIRRVVEAEADYLEEAKNLRRFSEILGPREGFRSPRPFEEWTRRSVLVMEYVPGVKLDQALAEMTDTARRDELLGRWVAMYAWLFHEVLELHADPHPGNFLLTPEGDIAVLDFGAVKACPAGFADGILDVLDACWQRDDERAARTYPRIGFGKDGADPEIFDPALLREYHEIVLEPFLFDRVFDFGAWRPARALKPFVLRHPGFLKLAPPADALMYFRVLSGIKGLLAKTGAQLNVHRMAVETARRRGRLTAEPRP